MQRRRAVCRTGQTGRREPVLFYAACPPQLSRPGHHRGHPRWRSAARSDRRQAVGTFTSATWLARAADRARLCLSCCALKLTDIVTPRGNQTSLRANAGTVANHIGSTAVLEYGPTEISPAVGMMLTSPARL